MKKIITLKFLILISCTLSAQNYTWMKGTNLLAQTGIYGTLTIPNSANNPGSRHGAATWVDAQGNLWLFGGEGLSSTNTLCWLNDLWVYGVATNQWIWVRGSNGPNQPGVYGTLGSPNSANQPGAREFATTWTDAAGNFWMFGGDGYGSTATFGRLGDLWKYNPAINQWTWVSGFNTVGQNGIYGTMGVASALNAPGARYSAAKWADASGNLWMFGGKGFPAVGPDGLLNDLWKFNITTGLWTWMNGTNLIAQNAIYGTLNVAAPSNAPGGIEFPASWIDAGNLYFFGGRGFPAAGAASYLNSFWKYNTTTNQWTWIGGSTTSLPLGAYGTQGISAPANVPGGRMSSAAWTDGVGNFWLFGGEGVPSSLTVGPLNDLFRYNLASNEWTWMRGANSSSQNGNYGTQGVSLVTNEPGARYYNNYWKANNNQFWLFGGFGQSASAGPDNLNDLWKLIPSCNPETVSSATTPSLCSGLTLTLTANGTGTAPISWYTVPSSGTAIATGTQVVTPPIISPNTNTTYTYYAAAANCTAYPRTPITITVNAAPSLTISGNTAICAGNGLTLTANGSSNSYSWSTGATTNSITDFPSQTTGYTVVSTGTNGCQTTGIQSVTVNPIPLLSINGNTTVCIGSSVILTASTTATSYTWNTGANTQSISVSPSVNSSFSLIVTDVNGCVNSASQTVLSYPLPTVSINAPSIICVGQSASLTASGATTYSWSNGQTNSLIVVSPNLSTVYSLTGTATQGSCSSTSSVNLQVSDCTGINEFGYSESDFNLYPNPSSGNIQLSTKRKGNFQIRIYNQLGELVFENHVNDMYSSFQTDLTSGIYLYRINAGKQVVVTGKLIIER